MKEAGVQDFYCFSIFFIFAVIISFSPVAQAFPEAEEAIICEVTGPGGEVVCLHEGGIVEARGNVTITYRDMKLTCNKITIYTETRDSCAEGSVVLSQPTGTLEGEKVIYNFDTKKGMLLKGRFCSGPYYGGAETAEKTGENELRLPKGSITTCDLEEPHYCIKARRIKIFLGDKVIARHAVFWVGRVPLFYLPYYSHSLKENRSGISLLPGHNDRWGYYLLSAWRYYSSDASRGYLRLDYRELKGSAYGVDYFFRTDGWGEGEVKSYYAAERGKETSSSQSRERSRYLVQLRHCWQLDKDTTNYLEYYRAKDAEVNKDYFYRDYEKDPQPPTRLSLIRTSNDPDYTLACILRKRTNRFYSEVEKLPSLKLDFNRRRIGGSRFYYQGEADFANLNKKTADASADTDAIRFDTYNELAFSSRLPRPFRWIEFSPYLGTRQTFYSRDKSGHKRDFFRGAFLSGGGLSTQFYRIYRKEGKFLGVRLNQLKHVLGPQLQYDYVRRPTVAAEQLGGFDDIDSLTGENRLRISLENKLQTRWPRRKEAAFTGQEETVDLAYLLTWIDYFPRQVSGESDFSDLGILLELRPYRWLSIDTDAYYDPYKKEFETINLDIFAHRREKWMLGAGHRYRKDSRSELTGELNYTISPKWKFRFYQRYEFESDELEEQECTIYRDLHCWLAELTVNRGGPVTGDTIFLVFRLKAFPEIPFGFSTSYHGRRGRKLE